MIRNRKNISRSVHVRLNNLAKEQGFSHQALLTGFANERFLFRVSQSEHAESFILKGAQLLRAWSGPSARTTRDSDFSAGVASSPEVIRGMLADIMQTEIPEHDGLEFDEESIKIERIHEHRDDSGLRAKSRVYLGSAEIMLQVDVGVGDELNQGPREVTIPPLLEDFPPVKLLGYPPEAVIAEKFETICSRGTANSRIKDFFDICLLSNLRKFDINELGRALVTTFKTRDTELESTPESFSNDFATDQHNQNDWAELYQRSATGQVPDTFPGAIARLRDFLSLLIDNVQMESPADLVWHPEEGWIEKD